jgi:hypothetical protein
MNMKKLFLAAVVIAAMMPAWVAGTPTGVETPADTIHPDIHQKVGDGSNANPNGVSPAGGGEIHGIGNVPGQGGDNPNDDGVNGQANELETMHGGIGDYNPQAD